MQGQFGKILALDLGTSSVGWALFSAGEDGEPSGLLDLGVRHFDEVIEPKSRELKNAARRTKRGMRTNLRRRRQRRDALLYALEAAGMVPTRDNPFAVTAEDPFAPYRLRAEALDRPLTLEEVGRAIFHLAKRRGFKSNRGAKMTSLESNPEAKEYLRALEEATEEEEQQTEEEKETGKILQAIQSLESDLDGRTLGQYLYARLQTGERVRGLHTHRQMHVDEFEAIWAAQASHHPGQMTEEAHSRIYRAAFHQRPLKVQKFLKGFCSLEKTKIRAERAQLVAQRFRYWQDLANLEFTNAKTGERRRIDLSEKQALAARLETVSELSWDAIRKELKLPPKSSFNLERAKGGKLKGNPTAAKISKRIPDQWRSMDEPQREQLVETLLTVDDRGKLFQTLGKTFKLEAAQAYELAVLELEGGTASFSSRAMRKILAQLEEGHDRITAQVNAGYEPWKEESGREPILKQAPTREEMPNPRVRKALGQVRRVVNALIREYGELTTIRIETARELSLTKKEKQGLEEANKKLAKENKEAEEWFGKLGIEKPDRQARFWYRLAKQCGWVCPYTGIPIPQEATSLSRFQIEHIVPYSRSLDDSYNNLTLCESHKNQEKGNRTPLEAFGGTPEWEHMVARAQEWRGPGSGHKRRLFTQTTPPDTEKMVERQLNETRYITREVSKFVRPVCQEVQMTKGATTAMLRKHWGLMAALYEDGEKSRDDLRHHAIDAVAIAFTSRSLFQKITRERKRVSEQGEIDIKVVPLSNDTVPPAPKWLFDQVKKRIATVVVSHETSRHIHDAFHEETALGLRNPTKGEYHVRKPLVSMTEGELKEIVDEGVRRLALEAFYASGKDAKKAFAEGLRVGDTVAKRARIIKTIPKAPMLAVPVEAPTKFFKLGNNHHVEIFEHVESGKRIGRYVTTLEAARRIRHLRQPVVNTVPDAPGWRFVMWLATNDIVSIDDVDGKLYLAQKFEGTNNKLVFREIQAATVDDDSQRVIKNPNTFRGTKLQVDAIGKVREIPEGTV